mmetsp:Transcript_26267/g.38937  ORF Transcript_26267/g.38937 Transcript_26267/m.38937 type:complete len:399 (-) Transcript_26267:136-1332(-)|eukprot:CAMPEP_0185018760 /NCGR_PEP_ID=MMETSP1103-20130426/1428_1 /TAXON_ID=36769 /ORGANISM="Paraphysomonas bandaiensis, Strain Caron Lab Isolate" /LENGTH=398 /DNA_ID=CAMNT_0027548719 /DNA_START=87 /DNA_END=1283 /DNA_ORIENTATION=-
MAAANTAAGQVVVVSVSADGPYGVVLEPDFEGCAAVVRSWARLPNGKFGPIQKHGGVHIGDVLFAINDIQLYSMPFSEVSALLSNKNIAQKNLKFRNGEEYVQHKRRNSRHDGIATKSNKEQKHPFLSLIRRSRINNFTSSRFVEYEVVCQLRAVSLQVEKEKIFKWSVWKRYSDFTRLHAELKRTLGWQMENIELPSAHSFILNKFAPDFMEQRREELNVYWQKVIGIDKVAEFNKHHCSDVLKLFIDVDGALKGTNKGAEQPEEVAPDRSSSQTCSETNNSSTAVQGSGNERRTSTRRLSTRALSRRQQDPSTRTSTSGARENSNSATVAAKNTSNVASKPAPVNEQPESTAQENVESRPAPPPPPPVSSKSASVPPKPTGARANLLGDINKLRKD